MNINDVVTKYTRAWTQGDFDAARGYLADDIDFQGSVETHTSADAFLTGLKQFYDYFYVSHSILEHMVGEDQVFLLYDCKMKNGKELRCAEHFTISAGKIQKTRLVFNAAMMG